MTMWSNIDARPLSDREYEVKVSSTSAEWGPNYPIYLLIESEFNGLGKCTFSPQT